MNARMLRVALGIEVLIYAIVTALIGREYGWSDGRVAAALLALILGVRLLVVAVTFGFGWVYRTPRTAQQRIGALAALWMFVEEYLSFLVLFLLIQPFERAFMGAERATRVRQGATPVLLVHGYGCNRGAWWWLRARLERASLNVATLNLEPMFGSIDQYAEPLRRRIDALCTETGATRIVLVAHSMGGLACRAYLAEHGTDRVAKLITLGSPHQGSAIARIGLGRNARQMEAGGAWLQALNSRLVPKGLRAVAIYSVHDNFVMPQDQQRLAGADNRPLSGLGHFSLLFSPRIRDALLAELR
jgi:triacylglycerol lipase